MNKTPPTVRTPRDLTRVVKLTLIVVISVISIARQAAWFASAQTIPTDATPNCPVAPAVFASWFESGTVAKDGVVKPADSVMFPDVANCSFYEWSEQMFLWLTSPAPPRYGGGGGRIFSSASFYDVSPPDTNGDRTFISHVSGGGSPVTPISTLRTAQLGAHGLKVIMDKRGRMFEVEQPSLSRNGKPLVRNLIGIPVEIESATIGRDGKPVFRDRAGRTILSPRAIVRPQLNRARTVQQFMIGKIPILLDPLGNVIETEEGQAGGGGVLLTQNSGLVYYMITVNDVYAYFLTGAKNGGINPAPTHFPTKPQDLQNIKDFALNAKGKVFAEPDALAIEIKTAWVEASTLANPASYITMQATIPVYDKTNPAHWISKPNQQQTVQLALVGMHVVGSTGGNGLGHPEMIWATFEHFGNAPNGSYMYNTTSGTASGPTDPGPWLFCSGNCTTGPFNLVQTHANGADLQSNSGSIGPTNTKRFMPWGAASNANPNPKTSAPTPFASNTDLISINHSVLSQLDQLANGDIRRNYFMTGSTWTIAGNPFISNFGNPGNPGVVFGKAAGTSQLANMTMETFQQTTNTFDSFSNNCFTCHNGNMLGDPGGFGLSHIYGPLKPLFP